MAGERQVYLSHLLRWLYYQVEASSKSLLDDEDHAALGVESKPRKQLDTQVVEEHRMVTRDLCRKHEIDHTAIRKLEKLGGAHGILAPPSCARDDGSEAHADEALHRELKETTGGLL